MKSSPTAQDVASLAGVSQSAVSRTFTAGASVSNKTRDAVLKAAKKLGYRPNALARSLSTNQSRMIALVMGYLDNQFYPLVIQLLSQSLQKQGYHLLLFIGQSTDFDADAILSEILQYQVDGIIMASATLSPTLAKDCSTSGVPVVLFNRISDVQAASNSKKGKTLTSSVTTDNYRGGLLAGTTLIERGYKRIGFMTGLENSSTSIERERGFKEALKKAGLKMTHRVVGQYAFEQAKEATKELLSSPKRPEAIFVANDHMAIAAIDVIRHDYQLRIPEDIGIIGFDDIPQAGWQSYQLTTISQNVVKMVEATVHLLMNQIQHKMKPENVVIPATLVERHSLKTMRSSPRQ